MRLNIFLNVGGNCEVALGFYEEHLGGKVAWTESRGAGREMTQVSAVYSLVHRVSQHR